MRSKTLYLPDGCSYSVTPIFGGMIFKNMHKESSNSGTFPTGWSIMINTDKPIHDVANSGRGSPAVLSNASDDAQAPTPSPHSGSGSELSAKFVKPTLNRDSLFISSLSLPSSESSQSAASRTRAIARMLWTTLWWYFHLEEPNPDDEPDGEALPGAELSEKPKDDWRVYIRHEGVLKTWNVLQKLDRMGLIVSEESSVGLDGNDAHYPAGWKDMFVSRRSFWQIDPRIFLFAMSPPKCSDGPSGTSGPSAVLSRRSSSGSQSGYSNQAGLLAAQYAANPPSAYYSTSNFPTYFPPAPAQYTTTDGVRHPIRPKPPRQGEVFYNRYIPSLGKTFALRVPHLPVKVSPILETDPNRHRKSNSVTALPSTVSLSHEVSSAASESDDDVGVLHRWMNNPRVNSRWGMAGPRSTQDVFLQKQLTDRHLFPAYGCFDGKPFGYFEICWMKEDKVGRSLRVPPGNWDRGLRCLIGEDDCIGQHRVLTWLSSLVHYCWLADNRTQSVICDPKVKNLRYAIPPLFCLSMLLVFPFSYFSPGILLISGRIRYIDHLWKVGFHQEDEFDTPQGRTVIMKINREDWESPAL